MAGGKKKSASSDGNQKKGRAKSLPSTSILVPAANEATANEKTQKSADSDKKKARIRKSGVKKKPSVKKSSSTSNNSNSSSSSVNSECVKKTEILRKKRERRVTKGEEMITAESPTTKTSATVDETSTPSHIPSSGSSDLPANPMRELVQDFAARCQHVTLLDLTSQFNDLPDASKEECKEFHAPRNAGKNRYANIYCLDRTRVALNFLTDRGFSQYIHANWVKHENLSQLFIITQGPLKRTVVDFWRMIWQYKCEFIIMLCQNMEENRNKCYDYFYTEEGSRLAVTPLEVITLSREEVGGIITTKLELRFEEKRHVVTHFLFKNWPDHQAPNTSFSQLFLLLDKVRGSKRPVVVHCSAGVGRSGTLVALEMCLMDLANHKPVDVFASVRKLRGFRCMVVQTLEQYMSLFMGILHFGKQNFCISASDMSNFANVVNEYQPEA